MSGNQKSVKKRNCKRGWAVTGYISLRFVVPGGALPGYTAAMSSAHKTADYPAILVVDDDQEIRELLTDYLNGHGFVASAAANGDEMKAHLDQQQPGLVVLDIMMPGSDGLELTREIRSAGSQIPIILLTAMAEDADRIVGPEMGADDYLTKPFNPRELVARIKAVLRRAGGDAGHADPQQQSYEKLSFGAFLICQTNRSLMHGSEEIELTAGEFDLLWVLASHGGQVLNRDQLLDLTRGREAGPFDRSIDVGIGRIRKKIETDPKSPKIIKTVRGGGYVLSLPVTQGMD